MIDTIYRHRSGTVIRGLSEAQLIEAAQDRQCRLWVDLTDPTPEEFAFVLETVFSFHPLAIEDTVRDTHVPKVDDYGSYLFLVFHAIRSGDETMNIITEEVDVFLGSHFLVTIHDQPRPTIKHIMDELQTRDQGLAREPAFYLYEVLDRQIDDYIPLIDRFEEQLEELGDRLFRNAQGRNEAILSDILTAKSSALRIRRILLPQRDLLSKLSRIDYRPVPPEARLYFHDVYDHLVRLTDLAESMRDLASSTIETHLALANNRLNEIMKVLTVISTIFIPLSFLASVYGMNFNYMPELNLPWSYPLLWLIFGVIAFSLLWLFRRRRWL